MPPAASSCAKPRPCRLAGTAAPFALNLASIGAASASTAADYKALVCVFLYGANDAHNTVVPYDAACYATYAGVRGALAWTPAELTPLAPTTPLPGGRQVALPAALAPLAALFDAGQCAVVANVGPLVVPTDRTSFSAKSVPLPPKLFSHNDQQSVWQASVPEGAKYGWGGRIGDLLASQNTNQLFTCNSLTGNAVFLSGPDGAAVPDRSGAGLDRVQRAERGFALRLGCRRRLRCAQR